MAEKNVALKLLGAERYACPLLDVEVVEKNDIVFVTEATAAILEEDVRTDALNNEFPMWVRVDPSEAEAHEEEAAAPAKASAAAQRRARGK